MLDKTGKQVVGYTYDSWGKLLSTTGSLKDTLGQKNPYRYRSYRYDSDTGLYYLNSRYYNPEWGRFINADGIVTTPGELLSGNMFAYCKNNPVNRKDPAGYRPILCGPGEEETPAMQRASAKIMLEAYKSKPSGFDWKASYRKAKASALIDKKGETLGGIVAKGKTVEKVYSSLTFRQFVKEYSFGAKITRKALGTIGTIGFAAHDVFSSCSKGEYVGALLDGVSAGIGFGLGLGLGAIGAAAITAGAPVIAVTGLTFLAGIGVGVGLDRIGTAIKSWWYKRE